MSIPPRAKQFQHIDNLHIKKNTTSQNNTATQPSLQGPPSNSFQLLVETIGKASAPLSKVACPAMAHRDDTGKRLKGTETVLPFLFFEGFFQYWILSFWDFFKMIINLK